MMKTKESDEEFGMLSEERKLEEFNAYRIQWR